MTPSSGGTSVGAKTRPAFSKTAIAVERTDVMMATTGTTADQISLMIGKAVAPIAIVDTGHERYGWLVKTLSGLVRLPIIP